MQATTITRRDVGVHPTGGDSASASRERQLDHVQLMADDRHAWRQQALFRYLLDREARA